jgi:hypothetical protein
MVPSTKVVLLTTLVLYPIEDADVNPYRRMRQHIVYTRPCFPSATHASSTQPTA